MNAVMKQNKLNRTVGITFLSQDIAYVALTGLQKTAALPYALSGFIFQLLTSYAKEYRVKGPDFQEAQKPQAMCHCAHYFLFDSLQH